MNSVRILPFVTLGNLKIAFVVHDYHRSGGHSRYVVELAERFAREHEVHVFANTFRTGDAGSIRFHRVGAWRANALTLILSFRWRATRMLRGGGFAVVHDQGLCCARPNVVTAHICNAAWSAAREDAPMGERIFGAIAARLEHWQYWRLGQARVIAVSGRVARDLARWYGYRGAPDVIHHGVDAALFSPDQRDRFRDSVRREIGVPAGEPLFLFVGDFRKGAASCIRALERGWLVCVGGAPAEEYRALAETLGRGARVVFHPATDTVEKYYAAADVFLLPSPYDSFGMVALEAMAAGLPVVVSREAGMSELIRDGENGFVLQNPGDLPGAMERALADSVVGSAARETALAHGWDRVAAETMAVYEQAREAPRILAFATQGAGGNDELRLRALLENFAVEWFPFDRRRKLGSFCELLRRLARGGYTLAVMEGTGIAGGAALLLARLFGQHYVVSSGDAVGPFIAAKQPLLGGVFETYERWLYGVASGFIGWSPYLTGRALTFGVRRAATAAGWADAAASGADVRRELGIPPNALVVGIAGSLDWNRRVGYCYGWELVQALALCRRTDVFALIVGEGSGLEELRRMAADQVIFTGSVPRASVPDYLAAMDIGSLPQSCDGLGSFRYTTKLSEYVAARLPVVTGQLPLAYDLDEGWLWRLPGDAPWDPRYIQALAALLDGITPEALAEKKAAVPVGSPVFDRARQVARVTALVRDVLETV